MSPRPRPPYDPQLLDAVMTAPPFTDELLPVLRSHAASSPLEFALEGRDVDVTDHLVSGYGGAEIIVSVLRRRDHTGPTAAAVYGIHGGGMILGDRWVGVETLISWVERYDAVAATVEYRLAPEFPDPVPVEDSYAGLVWFAEHAAELGFDPGRVLLFGGSAGGGLAAGTALLARDRGGPPIRAQLLSCPMLDDRDRTVSTEQFDGLGPWDRGANRFGWRALLGDRVGTESVSHAAAPSRAMDLSNLPPAYIDVGSAEVFRDEDVEYAMRIWAAGGEAELHVWNGGFHGFETVASAAVSATAAATREAWVRRHLDPTWGSAHGPV